jgi:hypothetical protein
MDFRERRSVKIILMNPENYLIQLSKEVSRFIGIDLIISGPIIALLSQLALAIREIALNTRKEFNSETEYKTLYWIATVSYFIGWCLVPIGIVLFIQSY